MGCVACMCCCKCVEVREQRKGIVTFHLSFHHVGPRTNSSPQLANQCLYLTISLVPVSRLLSRFHTTFATIPSQDILAFFSLSFDNSRKPCIGMQGLPFSRKQQKMNPDFNF